MIDRFGKGGNRSAFWTLVVVALAAVLIPASMADARIKPKTGVYYDATSVRAPGNGYIQTANGKVFGAGFNVRFKTRNGRKCVPAGFIEANGYISMVFDTKKKTKPDRKNSFTVKNKRSRFNPGLRGTVTGHFKSRNKAAFRATLKADGCTAKVHYTKAVWSTGG
ncbi:MAG: hypothetical protein JJE13_11035 [Thermoleophilia bacterium]|nr:hypothetical protein [Thermoleophilia bacterium]